MRARSVTGTVWVCAQVALLALWYVSLPGGSWSARWFSHIPLALSGTAILLAGCTLALAGTFSLGRNLTPSPVPKRSTELIRDGVYRRVRHPIYGGILLIVWGITLPFLHTRSLIWASALLLFFYLKSAFEEKHLDMRFPEYDEYRRSTWRFLPKFPANKRRA